VLRITEGNRTFVDWWAESGVFPADEQKVVDRVKERHLSPRLSRQSPNT
jgi:hypothetical protein